MPRDELYGQCLGCGNAIPRCLCEKTLTVNTPAALAAMMRQAQSNPEFRANLLRAGIPFGSLASALESYAKCREALERIGAPDFVYITDDDDMENPQLVMRMADARATLATTP